MAHSLVFTVSSASTSASCFGRKSFLFVNLQQQAQHHGNNGARGQRRRQRQRLSASFHHPSSPAFTTLRTTTATATASRTRLFSSSSCSKRKEREKRTKHASLIPEIYKTTTSTSTACSSIISNSSNSSSNSNSSNSNSSNIHQNDNKRIDYPLLSTAEIKNQIGQNRTIATTPFSWKQLQTILIQQNDPSLLSRSIQVQSNYMHYTREMKQQWRTMNDCIVYNKFGHLDFSTSVTTNSTATNTTNSTNSITSSSFTKVQCTTSTNQYKITPTIQQTKQNNIILQTVLPNDFPYYVDANIQHWCLWKLNDCVMDEDIQCAIQELKCMARDQQRQSQMQMQPQDDGHGNANTNANAQLGQIVDTISWINPKHLQSIPDIDHAHILCLREIM